MREVVDYPFDSFSALLQNHELLESYHLIDNQQSAQPLRKTSIKAQSSRNVEKQGGNIHLENSEKHIYKRYKREMGDAMAFDNKSRFLALNTCLCRRNMFCRFLSRWAKQKLCLLRFSHFAALRKLWSMLLGR